MTILIGFNVEYQKKKGSIVDNEGRNGVPFFKRLGNAVNCKEIHVLKKYERTNWLKDNNLTE